MTAPAQIPLDLPMSALSLGTGSVPEAAPEPVVPHFLHCVGSSFYPTIADFVKEAEQYGISRRLRAIPKNLVPGQSRIYLGFGAGHESTTNFCDKCIGYAPCETCGGLGRVANPRLTTATSDITDTITVKRSRKPKATVRCAACYGKGTKVVDRAPLPSTTDATEKDGRRVVTCGRCQAEHEVTSARGGTIFGYFIPDRIEIVLRVSDEAAKVAALLSQDLITIEGDPQDEVYRVRGTIDADNPAAAELLRALGLTAESVQADILGKIRALPGSQIVAVVKEPLRGCGVRAHGGAYVVSGPTESPLHKIDPQVEYDGPHFRGIVNLSDSEARELDAHVKGERVVVLRRRAAAGEASQTALPFGEEN